MTTEGRERPSRTRDQVGSYEDIVAAARKHRVATGELNRFIEAVTAVHPPASPGRRAVTR